MLFGSPSPLSLLINFDLLIICYLEDLSPNEEDSLAPLVLRIVCF